MNARVSENPILLAVRRGLTNLIPILLFGSIALVFLSLPIPIYQEFMASLLGVQLGSVFTFVRDSTFNILSLLMVISISYAYVIEISERDKTNISPVIAVMVSLSSFVALSGISKDGFTIAKFGVIGVFIAIVVAVVSSVLFVRLSSSRIFHLKAFTDGASSSFQYAIDSILPATLTVLLFATLNQGLATLFNIHDLQFFISDSLVRFFAAIESHFVSGIFFIFLVHLLWFFGIHGNNVLEPVAQAIFDPSLLGTGVADVANSSTLIFSKTFFDNFVLMGGCGATLCLVLVVLLVGKFKNMRRLAKMAVGPVVFNISEIIVFGMPIVLNPVFLLPFIGVPLLLTIISFGAMQLGWVPIPTQPVEWTTPILLSGYASTGSWLGSFLQLFNLVVGMLCYWPFVRLAEKLAQYQISNNLKKVYDMYEHYETRGTTTAFLTRRDSIGNTARFLAADLGYAINNNRLELFYQPLVDNRQEVAGVEALLRWKHEAYGFIQPPLIVAIAEEASMIDVLGNWIFRRAFADTQKLRQSIAPNLDMSINISANQLNNDSFITELADSLTVYALPANCITIEITERLALGSSQKTYERLLAIKEMGIKLAMDDFGMGHSSLLYLKELSLDKVKIDGSLVRELLTNSSCSSIIASITALGQTMGYEVVAEYVETQEQQELLQALGCDAYQGYLYSPALPIAELKQFLVDERSE
jgi:lactose/cellobiose-specific phosphotransferase system IIC component